MRMDGGEEICKLDLMISDHGPFCWVLGYCTENALKRCEANCQKIARVSHRCLGFRVCLSAYAAAKTEVYVCTGSLPKTLKN
jgi:hypothetical protein